MSISWQSDAEPAPRILVLPPAAANLDEAHRAIEQWQHYSGKTLDPTQRLVVEVMMAETAAGRWAARSTGREMPRQNGKGDEIEVVEFWGLTQRGEAILHTAHELITVSSAHERMMHLFGHRDMKRKVRKVLNGMGQQMIELHNGGVIQYRTRTKGGGRGLDDISRLVVDEAQHAQPEQLASSTPTLLANPNPQTNFAGTGAIDGVSAWWWEQRKRALGNDPGDFGYVGHTAERVWLDADGRPVQERLDPKDRTLWPIANPALWSGRAELEFLAEQLRTLGPDLFAREHLGVWDAPPPDGESAIIPIEVWMALEDAASTIAVDERIALDVSEDRKWSAFARAGRRSDGRVHVEIPDRRPGTDWVVARARDGWELNPTPIGIEKSSPAAAFIEPLRSYGIEVVEITTAEHAQHVGRFIDDVTNDQLRHLGGSWLVAALRTAVLRSSGDASVWSRRQSGGDITSLVAATLAVGQVPAVSAPEIDPSMNVW